MNIGLIDVDNTRFPNLALGKIAAYHRSLGDSVEWADPMFGSYDRVYASKVFTFTPDFTDYYDCEVVKGGTGYDIHSVLPDEIDHLQPDYSIYPEIDSKTAYGFLTRGCPNKCKWCCVPREEGNIRPYMDVDEIAINGRNKLILMDNNILACDYGLEQIEKIIKRGYRVDFNQALDARLVTEEIAAMLAKVHWLCPIRFGCDTPRQIGECERVRRLDEYNGLIVCFPAEYVMACEVEPIPITPELLKEFGFEDCAKKRWHTEDWGKRWGECQYLSFTKLYRGEWRVHYFDGAKDRGQTVVRYLHEAEAFLGLHNIELIEE